MFCRALFAILLCRCVSLCSFNHDKAVPFEETGAMVKSFLSACYEHSISASFFWNEGEVNSGIKGGGIRVPFLLHFSVPNAKKMFPCREDVQIQHSDDTQEAAPE